MDNRFVFSLALGQVFAQLILNYDNLHKGLIVGCVGGFLTLFFCYILNSLGLKL